MKTYIYILQDPVTLDVRYVGKSTSPSRRYQSHLWQKPKVKYHSYYWIQSLLKKELKPIMTIIDETEENWQELEQYWIEQFRQWGFNLTNITTGGEGAFGAGQWNNESVSVFEKDGYFIKSFISHKECANYFKTSSTNVTRAAGGHVRLMLKKYQVRQGITSENIDPYNCTRPYIWSNKPIIYWTSRSILCIEDNIEFSSISSAATHYNVGITSIANNLKKMKGKLKNGKSFRYTQSVCNLRNSIKT